MINAVLIANRGEIACRIARTCRRLGIGTVAVHSDADAGALHVAACDAAVHLPGTAPADTYLRADLLIDAARRAGADAIHPGYGFLAESADFARAVTDAGLTWIGPPPVAIAAMGSKIEAKALMRTAGVPVLLDSNVAEAREIGLPLLVKASAGGGGRGMRVVRTLGELDDAREAAAREAAAAFGDGTVFYERYVERGRHVEIQVFADSHGNVVSLHERECSIQRRHQKIVEESPSPAVDAGLRRRMADAAVTAASAVGYVGAGTVEFLLEPDGRFWFLEMNTRLQVEHPVTELVTGLDLVELQTRGGRGRSAAGSRLRRPARRPRHRGPPDGRGPVRRLPPVDGHLHPVRDPRRRPRRHRDRRRLDGVAVLRLDGRQGHRPRTDPRRGHPHVAPGAPRRPAARSGDQPRPAAARPRAPRLHRRRPAHRVPRRAPVHRPHDRRRAARSGGCGPRRAGRQPRCRGSPRRHPVGMAQQPGRRPARRAARSTTTSGP